MNIHPWSHDEGAIPRDQMPSPPPPLILDPEGGGGLPHIGVLTACTAGSSVTGEA